MASNSKKRRRVLRVSCILAALIIAGSSFAWFTSKDEVTNRLTANADYGVSIVESFAPPANWLPGQEINKDVYAVNTGNIAAFVKEELSGVLDYSYETLVSKFEVGCVQLVPMAEEQIDGATTNEAGSFLAWTDAEGVETGFVNSARDEDVTNGDASNAWHPTKTGHYIFRRSIGTKHVAAVGNPGDPNYVAEHDETVFTYAGYYFVKGTTDDANTPDVDESKDRYYKIVIGNDTFRAANDGANPVVKEDGTVRYEFDILCKQEDLVSATSTVDPVTGDVTVTKTAITPNADGTFDTAPVISYVKVVDLDPQDVSFKYNDGTDDKYGDDVPYLMVRFSNAQGDLAARTTELKAAKDALEAAKDALIVAQEAAAAKSHELAELEVTYRNAEYDYYTSLARYNKTKADMDYANALVTATNKLYEPAFKRATAEETMNNLKQAMEDAAKEVRAEANREQGETNTADGVAQADLITDNYNSVKSAMLDDTAGTTTGIASSVLVPQTIRDLINNNTTNPPSATPGGSDLTQAKENLAVLDSIWTQIAGSDGTGATDGILKKITDDYDKFQATVAVGNKETDTDPAILDREATAQLAQGYLQDLIQDFDRLEELLDAYATAYTQFVEVDTTNGALEAALTDLQNGEETAVVGKIESYSTGKADADTGKINALEAKANTLTDGLKKAIKDYKDAYEAYYNYMDPDSTTGYYKAVKDWNDAVKAYNDEVYKASTEAADSAKETYDNTIDTTKVNTKNLAVVGTTVDNVTGGGKKLHSDGAALVAGFSAHSVGNNTAAQAAEIGSNLTERTAGVGGAVSAANTDATDPRITGADTNYERYVLANETGDGAGQYDNTQPFDATTNNPYKQMTQVDTKAEDTFYQLNADPNGTGAAKQKLSDLNTDLGTDGTTLFGATGTIDNPAANSAQEKYQSALDAATAAGGAIANLTAAEQNVANAEAALNAARIAQAVQNNAASNINIDVVLDQDVVKSSAQASATGATWVFDEATDETQTPTFYYNRILDAGKTSEKLVDKLVFCDTVTAKDFTELTFDLNVALDSMQVTYDPQNNTDMTATAVNASDDFDLNVTAIDQTTKAVTWDAAPAVATVYKVGDDVVTINTLGTAVTVGNTDYGFQIEGTDYYGVTKPEAGSTATYYKIDTTGATPVLVTGEGSTVTVTATAG